jgi:hypothetical protein
MTPPESFSLERFEQYAFRRRHEEAMRELLTFLRLTDRRLSPNDRDAENLHLTPEAYYTRVAAAASAVFADNGLNLSAGGCAALLPYHRVLTSLFGATVFGNADHILTAIQPVTAGSNRYRLQFKGSDLPKLALLCSAYSNLGVAPDLLWKENPMLAASLFFGMLSSPVLAGESAYRKAEEILSWLPSQLEGIELADHHLACVHLPWFQTSYYSAPHKHRLKAAINRLIRRRLLADGFVEPAVTRSPRETDRPVVVVVLEHFRVNHSMYRCYENALRALRTRFRLIGMGRPETFDSASAACFDDVVAVAKVTLTFKELAEAVAALKPDIVFYPSVGMWDGAIFLTNLRLAPIQVMSLGHPATSYSEAVDYVIVEEGYLGDPGRFTEKVVLVPNYSMPFNPHPGAKAVAMKGPRPLRSEVRIGMPAFAPKISPMYLTVCRAVAEKHKGLLSFHVFAGASGPVHLHVAREIRRFLPSAVVYPYMEYEAYLKALGACDLCLNPFPFGNTNGIVDAAALGLPFVCMDGPEVHSHADAELSRRLGLPPWLVAQTEAQYVQAALRLIEAPDERHAISEELGTRNSDKALYQGNAGAFCNAVWTLYLHHERIQASSEKTWRPEDVRQLG